jgi:hypothetical protein
MRAWIIRFVSLYVFDVIVLLLIGALVPGVTVGWSALWAAVVLAAATIWLKPLIHRGFTSLAARSSGSRSWLAEKGVQYLVVLAVAAIIWVLLVLFTGVNVRGFVFGWFVPPLLLLIAWAIYDLLDDRIEARAGELYDRATGGRRSGDAASSIHSATGGASASAPGRPSPSTPRPHGDDGLTDEQRRMLDGL